MQTLLKRVTVSSTVLAMVLFLFVGCGGGQTVDPKVLEATIRAQIVATQTANAPSGTSTPMNTAMPALTNTPVNTTAPTPTFTPRSTVTPVVTNMPVQAPLATVDSEAVKAMLNSVNILGDALTKVGTMLSNPQLSDSQWKTELVVQMALVRRAHQDILALQVTSRLGAVRAGLLDATTDCDAAMIKLARGIDNLDPGDIGQAGTLITSCGDKLTPAVAALNAMQ